MIEIRNLLMGVNLSLVIMKMSKDFVRTPGLHLP